MNTDDPMLAAVARARAEEEAFAAAAAADDYFHSPQEAHRALAATIATTPAGLAALTGFVREMTAEIGDFYFEGKQAVAFAVSLDTAVRRIFGLDQDVT
jgi:hypothetical protein